MRSESGCCGGAQGSARKPEATSSALEILAEHFARGEIDKAMLGLEDADKRIEIAVTQLVMKEPVEERG